MSSLGRFRTWVSEIYSGVIPVWGNSWMGIRSQFKALGNRFWGTQPAYENTIINYDKARQYYRNDGTDASLGAGFCAPIVDLQVSFMGIPRATTDDDDINDRLNECLENYWLDEIQQIFRNAIRDSKVIARLRQDVLDNPLITVEEREHCRIEIINPESITIQRDMRDPNRINQAIIVHKMLFVEEEGDPVDNVMPQTSEHEVFEIITPEEIEFYDNTDKKFLPELAQDNRFGFVPVEEIYNEFDSTLNGGQSDFEGVLPFIHAFHDVLHQGLQAHKYHSIPKVKFKIREISNFLKNNFPESLDENGNVKASSEISWRGKEILFFTSDEDAEFLEAKSVLGDTKTLAEFLIDCICIASATPEWAFMHVDAGSANSDRNAQTVPFVKKIQRKRRGFTKHVQNLLKMYLVVIGEIPTRAKLIWEPVRPDDSVVEMQAIQQLIMGLEVAKQSQIISDHTYREMLRMFIPAMKNPTLEKEDAKENTEAALQPTSRNGQGQPTNVPVGAGPQGGNE